MVGLCQIHLDPCLPKQAAFSRGVMKSPGGNVFLGLFPLKSKLSTPGKHSHVSSDFAFLGLLPAPGPTVGVQSGVMRGENRISQAPEALSWEETDIGIRRLKKAGCPP